MGLELASRSQLFRATRLQGMCRWGLQQWFKGPGALVMIILMKQGGIQGSLLAAQQHSCLMSPWLGEGQQQQLSAEVRAVDLSQAVETHLLPKQLRDHVTAQLRGNLGGIQRLSFLGQGKKAAICSVATSVHTHLSCL